MAIESVERALDAGVYAATCPGARSYSTGLAVLSTLKRLE